MYDIAIHFNSSSVFDSTYELAKIQHDTNTSLTAILHTKSYNDIYMYYINCYIYKLLTFVELLSFSNIPHSSYIGLNSFSPHA